MRRFVSLLILLATLAITVILPVPAYASTAEGAASDNASNYDYYSFDFSEYPCKSYLNAESDSSLTRVESVSSGASNKVYVERYDSSYHFMWQKTLAMELPLFGGCYFGSNYNFVVFGQKNLAESNGTEVSRIVKYDKTWRRLGAASISGSNIQIPFYCGDFAAAQSGDFLYILPSHNMYKSEDGINHQKNLFIKLRISDMKVLDHSADHTSSYTDSGRSSHSFRQFLGIDSGKIVTVDQGDANPRGILLNRYSNSLGSGMTWTGERNTVYAFSGTYGANGTQTGSCVGGFEISDSAYLIAVNSVAKGASVNAQRNIAVLSSSKSNPSAVTLRWITNHPAQANAKLSSPHFVKINSNKFIVIWKENELVKWSYVNANGAPYGSIYSGPSYAMLSDCKPIYKSGKIIWYAQKGTSPVFHEINPATNKLTLHYDYGFIDVANLSASDKEAISYCVSHNLISGTSDITFSPNKPLTRAMLVTMLWRLEGSPKATAAAENPFVDVSATNYYYNAVLWAYENNITAGTTATTFSPNENLQNRQMLALCFAYAKQKGINTSGKVSNINVISDIDDAGYALSAYHWALYRGIISYTIGTDGLGHVYPKNNATRLECVRFLYKLVRYYDQLT